MRRSMKLGLLSAIGLIGLVGPARGGVITPTDAFNNWTRAAEPDWNYNLDLWKVSGAQNEYLDYWRQDPLGPIGQALISNFSQTGDFTFSSRVVNFGRDSDAFGLIFGYQDPKNLYVLSFDGGGYSWGVFLARKVNGVMKRGQIYSKPRIRWMQNTSYDMTVGRSGSTIFMNIDQVGGPHITDFHVTDTTFMTGRIGIFASSQTSRWSNLDYEPAHLGIAGQGGGAGQSGIQAVPEPSTLALTGISVACVFAFGRRRAGTGRVRVEPPTG